MELRKRIELNGEEIEGLIIIDQGGDEREISAYTTNELMERELVGFGISGLYLTKRGKGVVRKQYGQMKEVLTNMDLSFILSLE